MIKLPYLLPIVVIAIGIGYVAGIYAMRTQCLNLLFEPKVQPTVVIREA